MKDEHKQPNIIIRNIILTDSSFNRQNEFLLPLQVQCHFNYEKRVNDLRNDGQCVLSADISLLDSVGNSAANLKCSFVGLFSVTEEQNMSLAEFLEYNAAAHLLPFIREHVANLTIKAGLPPVYLPPYNMKALIEEGSGKLLIP